MQVEVVNQRLKEDGIPVRLLQRGQSLYLQATLPPKPGDPDQRRKQRQIPLKLKVGKQAIEEARFRAYELGRQLQIGHFNWNDWIPEEDKPKQPTTFRDWVDKFHAEYSAIGKGSETTWQRHWMPVYNRLPLDKEPAEVYLMAVVTSIDPNETPWTRHKACQKLQKLADFIGLKIDLKPYQGNYTKQQYRREKKLYIPSDDEILEWYEKIPEPSWQWAYGMMAAYGLRNHEIFFCEFSDRLALTVLEGKTGRREGVMPIYPVWVEQWNLTDIKKPNCKGRPGKGYREYGERVSRQFERYEIPFTPYALRHAYGIRGTIVEGMPESTMAAYMGHSELVHLTTYNRFASKEHHMQAYRKNILKED
ncbi:MAG TPA: hypothetical protein V6C46_10430 [Coleofasciculaceae cyanobacterium]